MSITTPLILNTPTQQSTDTCILHKLMSVADSAYQHWVILLSKRSKNDAERETKLIASFESILDMYLLLVRLSLHTLV